MLFRSCFQLALSDECIDRFGFHLQYLGGVRNGIGPFAKFLARWRAIDLMIFDLIGIPFLKAGNNDTPFVVYQKEVPPGPFAITDLQLAGGGADLDVSVKEADGSVTTYLVPYAAVPNMLQPGVSKYDFAAGRSHIEGASKQSDFVQAGYQYGFNNLLTLYGEIGRASCRERV